MAKNFGKYSPEFKIKVVQLKIFEKMETDEICKKYNIDSETLNNWVDMYMGYGQMGMSGNKEDSISIAEMNKRVKELEIENEILRKFNATFQRIKEIIFNSKVAEFKKHIDYSGPCVYFLFAIWTINIIM